ncbi:MAG: zinc-ribbon domain-containing protein [Planctomycetota bacterium]|nr:zinc-ribbon domain-containing protein [Planctomycetota bacterium]
MTELPLLQYECPHCGGQFQVDASLRGGHVTCPSCQGVVALAGQTPAAVAEGDRGQDVSAEPIWLNCPVCQGVFRAGQDMAGQQVICPHCQNRVAVPGPASIADAAGSRNADQGPASAQALAGNRPKSPNGDKGVAAQAPLVPELPDGRSDKSAVSWPVVPDTADQLSVTMDAGDETAADRVGTVDEGGVSGIQIHESRRTVAYGDRVIELRPLTPKEKARQRLVKNIVVFAVGAGILISYLLYHVGFWPFGR